MKINVVGVHVDTGEALTFFVKEHCEKLLSKRLVDPNIRVTFKRERGHSQSKNFSCSIYVSSPRKSYEVKGTAYEIHAAFRDALKHLTVKLR